jgi:DNA-binding transcriptional ArsR family regulator
MAQVCGVCKSPKRKQIESAIGDGTAAKAAIARAFGLGRDSVTHHMTKCMPGKIAVALREEGVTLATRTAEMRAIVQQVLDKLAETGGEESPLQALSSGLLAMKLKAVDTLGKLAELEFGTKSKVTTTVDPRAEWSAMPPAEKRMRVTEMKHRLLELEREAAAGENH